MVDFETTIQDAVAAQEIPGCAVAATSRDGSFTYSKAFGATSMDSSRAKPFDLNTMMWVASCTKLMTSISAMQLVERGKVTLDEPIYRIIPELEEFKVLTGFTDEGAPIEEKHKKPITLRNLLTHSSGLVYEGMGHPLVTAWSKYYKKRPSGSGKLLERFTCPLMFEPGTSWTYGPGIDYVGLAVERISGLTLEEYMKKHLWRPLDITDVTFFPSTRPDLQARMADMSERTEEGKVKHSDSPMPYLDGEGKEVVDCMGGQGSFTCVGEYIKVLKGVLACDEGGEGKILSKASLEEFFKPQLSEGSREMLNAVVQDDMANNAMGNTPKHLTKDYGLGGIIITSDAPDGRKAGTMHWGGYPNLIWWMDRKTGLCGIYGGQVVPPGDPKCAALTMKWEEGAYELFEKHGRNGESKI
ncbi:beta-lactamase/transpeptidase-like protein [Alternaria alternata]|nr:beta-lactamase/transpeptidase-like protein [Alternaria alternata]